MDNINITIDQAIKRAADKFEGNPFLFGMAVFGNYFRKRSSEFHKKIMSAACKFNRLAIAAPRESAKAQSLNDSHVLTPKGWKKFRDICVGDILFDGNGGKTKVIGMNEITEMDLYKVTFQDGSCVICNLDHLWEVYCPSNTGERKLVKPLREILSNYKSPRYDDRFDTDYFEYRYYVKCTKPIDFPRKDLPLDPYTLGVWLGDGHSAGYRITTGDKEIMDNIPYPYVKHKAKYNWQVKGITKILKKLDLIKNKHIPDIYLFSSLRQREELLQGLIDTDGHIPIKKSQIEFTNINYRLIKGVQYLVRSIGVRASLRDNWTTCNGQRFHAYKLHIVLPPFFCPSKLQRKLKNYKQYHGEPKNRIVDISFYKRDYGRCINVDNTSGTYITDDFIKTHNSTYLGFLYPIYCIVFKKKRFIVFLMNTEEKAKGSLSGIKKEIRENKILSIFGIEITKDTETDTVFTHRDGYQTRVLCKGATQMGSIRGERFGPYRPDLAIIDDLEDDEMVRNPDRRRELQEVFDDAVEPAVDRDLGQIIFIGTVIHDDALISKVTSTTFYTEYHKLFYQALNPTTGVSLWSEKWTVEQLRVIEKNNPEKFAKEYQNDPVSGSRRSFKKEDWRYWNYNNENVVLLNADGSVYTTYSVRDCKAGIGCDLAWEEKRSSDFTVIMPGLLTPNDEILIDEYVCEKGMKPDVFSDILFPMVNKYETLTGGVVEIGFEKAKHEKIMKWLLGKEFTKRRKYLILKDVRWDADKITRIITRLQPRYVNHTIYHRSGMGELEYQLMRLPDGTHDDLADACSVLEQILKYPKAKKRSPDYDDEFEWLLKQVKERNKVRPYVFGGKINKDNFPLPCHKSYR